MLTWLSCGAAATASPPEQGAAVASSSALLAAGEASACSSLTADDSVSTRCATGCEAGYCLVPGGWKCTCTSSPLASLLPADDVTEQRLLLGEGSRGRSGSPDADGTERLLERSGSPLTPSCAALAEIDPERTINQTALVAGGWDLARRHPRLVVVFLGCALELARTPAASEMPSSRAQRQLDKDEELESCPLNTPNASDASSEILRLHRTMLEAGFLRLDGSHSSSDSRITDPRAQLKSEWSRGAGNHETRMWPRPAVCASHPGHRLDMKEYIERPQLSKLVNARRGLEYRPILKSGSTMMRHLLPCLQPGQWEEVPQASPVRDGSTLLVLQRDPIIRFASALVEVMERTFRKQCPEGPCNKERDGFEEAVTPAAVKNATLWYEAAELLLGAQAKQEGKQEGTEEGSNAGSQWEVGHKRRLRMLVSAAALDASCNLKYYASVHFASQTGLLMQGPTPPETPVRFYDLETLGEDLEALLSSDLVRTMLGDDAPPSKAALESCLGQERTARVNVALRSLSSPRTARSRVILRAESAASVASAAGAESAGDGDLPQNHHDDRTLPSSSDLVEAIEGDPPTKLLLESMFRMDTACTAPPAPPSSDV